MKTPTIEEVMKAAEKHYEKECKDCAMKDECDKLVETEQYRDCMRMFLAAVIAGKLNLDGTPVHGEKPEPAKPALPKWCKVGAWVLSKHKNHLSPSLWRITKIEGYNVEAYDGKSFTRRGNFRNFSPARFREPTLEEAYSLLGKVIDHGDGKRELVLSIDFNFVELIINGVGYHHWKSCSIDGHPFGVPEVDTDAEAQA